MIIYKQSVPLQTKLALLAKTGKTIGFVPTMGALHQGHLSLIEKSRKTNSVTVCSIFVNPTQFNDKEDFKNYPVTLESDILLLEEQGVDILFLPAVSEIYPEGLQARPHFELGYLETILEGHYRPGHFQGVCAVIQKMLEIIQPVELYLGQKDYQQCLVIEKLLSLYRNPTKICVVPTLRQKSGLAMSSRNLRLNEKDRKVAAVIYKQLNYIQKNLSAGSTKKLTTDVITNLYDHGFEKVDYVELCNASTLNPVSEWDGREKLVALLAATLNGVRLIDNLLVS